MQRTKTNRANAESLLSMRTMAATPATMGHDMDVPAKAHSLQECDASEPSLAAE